MKNFICTSFLALLTSGLLHAQSLNVNNVNASIFSNGALFFNGGSAVFEVPKGSGLSTVFAANLWIGSIDQQGALRVAAQTYAQANEGGPSFNFGPVTDSGAYTAPQLLTNFSRVLEISRGDINQHQANYMDANYIPVTSIANWIGSGDVTKGVSPVLMPFHDTDGSGRYEPINGDFPVINGDKALQVLFSDNRVGKAVGNGRLNINIALQAFAVDAPNDSALNNTIFLRYRLHNVSGLNYDSLYLANWTDLDIGDYSDDYVGSDPSRNAFYGYNASNNDNTAQGGYGTNPPAQAVVFLSHPMSRFVYYNNDTSVIGNPTTAQQKFGYMRGNNLAGQPLTEQFMFAGDPVAGTGSNELTLANLPGDRRGLGIMSPISLAAGASVCVDFAYVYGRGSNYLNSVTVMRSRIDSVRAWYQNQTLGCAGLFTSLPQEVQQLHGRAFPNPFKHELNVQLEQALTSSAELSICDMMGRELVRETWVEGQQRSQMQMELPAGMYLLRLQGANQVFTTRLIKQ
jgi:hypothetical protein